LGSPSVIPFAEEGKMIAEQLDHAGTSVLGEVRIHVEVLGLPTYPRSATSLPSSCPSILHQRSHGKIVSCNALSGGPSCTRTEPSAQQEQSCCTAIGVALYRANKLAGCVVQMASVARTHFDVTNFEHLAVCKEPGIRTVGVVDATV
jgi:hypothetical protein